MCMNDDMRVHVSLKGILHSAKKETPHFVRAILQKYPGGWVPVE